VVTNIMCFRSGETVKSSAVAAVSIVQVLR
jgi:hypothetical protein